ncbi:aldo/keto reductase [Hansschlegelia plantiphila]|uniref:Oxidoreductase n=1 Tax=Hansschlegelia plantiphila TaxID=374655 RepID=A0A9W6J4V1_9HYPH|nr:aldo/keto reductase [Hansschlegelia plantiphila]GLK69394.1 oxidoreductase [Hansschlegelia plantiphila]
MLTTPGKAPLVAANGASIPALGFGTWQLRGVEARDAVVEAIRVGYRHIDTAQIYENETDVGNGLRLSGIARDEMFLTTKVWTSNYRDGDLQRSVEESLKRLGVVHVDLLLLHWPNPETPLAETMKALNAVRAAGLARDIGVSNFPTRELREAIDLSGAPLVTDQVEYHAFLDQSALKAELDRGGMALTAYSPIARGKAAHDETIRTIAQTYAKSASQVALRWLIQQDGVIAIPRSSKKERIAENFDVFDFTLSDEEMARISALRTREGRLTSPSFAPEWD